MKVTDALMVFNAGSSSIKFALYEQESMVLIFHGNLTNITIKPELKVFDSKDKMAYSNNEIDTGYKNSIKTISVYVSEHLNNINIKAIGHRVVHGGADLIFPTLVNSSVLKILKQQASLAPSHQPYSIELIETFTKKFPDISNVVCFDTEFHNTMPEVAKLFALPEEYKKRGIIRYGFHGISYEYIASTLHDHSIKSEQRIIVAHLGNGASLCAMKNMKSVETTMSFTTLDGLMMSTRCGSMDPGVILYLMEQGMTVDELSDLLYNRSGLMGVSGISPDINELLNNDSSSAKLAVDMFCYHTAKHMAGLITALGGLDAIVFTAGIGGNSPTIRQKICDQLAWLGLKLDDVANNNNFTNISTNESKVKVLVIPTNEELVIARKTCQLIKRGNAHAA